MRDVSRAVRLMMLIVVLAGMVYLLLWGLSIYAAEGARLPAETKAREDAVLQEALAPGTSPVMTFASANVVLTVTVEATSTVAWGEVAYFVNYSVSDSPAPSATLVFTMPVTSYTYDGVRYEYQADWAGFATGDYTYDYASRRIIWTLGTVPDGTAGQEMVIVRFPAGPLDGSVFRTTAAFGDAGGTHITADAPPVIIRTEALVQLESIYPGEVCPARSIHYSLITRNTGTSDLFNLVLTDTLPTGITLITATMPFSQAGSVITWTFPYLPVGDDWLVDVVITTDASLAGTSVPNLARVTCDQNTSDDAQYDIQVLQPYLILSKQGPSYIRPGDTFTYCIKLQGSCISGQAVMTDTLPVGLTAITATPPYTLAGNQVIWPHVSVDRLYTLTVQADNGLALGTAVTNLAEALDPGVFTVSMTHFALVTPTVPLEADKFRYSVYASVGFFRIKLANSSTTPVTDLDIVDRVPTNTLFTYATSTRCSCWCFAPTVSISVHYTPSLAAPPLDDPGWLPYSGGSGPYGSETRWVRWHIPSLAYQCTTLEIGVLHLGLPEGTLIYNTAWYTSPQASGILTATYTVPPQPPLYLSTWAYPSLVSPDQEVEFGIEYWNPTNISATHTLLTSTLPITASFVSADQGGTYISKTHQVVWDLDTLGPDKRGIVTVRVFVPRGTLDRSPICHQALLSSAEHPTAGPKEACSTVRARLVFKVTKESDSPIYLPGSTVTYTLTYRNIGDGAVAHLSVLDRLPKEMTFVTATASPDEKLLFSDNPASSDAPPPLDDPSWTPHPPTRTTWVRWKRLAPVQIETTYAMTLVLRNQPTSPIGTQITNTVIIVGENLPFARTAQSIHLVEQIPHVYPVYLPLIVKPAALPDLIVRSLTVQPSSLWAGQPASITLLIENIGTAPANGPFWVDLYINPDPALMPPKTNQTWDQAGSQFGIAWLITPSLSLAPGDQITLTSQDYADDWSFWPGYFTRVGDQVLYAQVDSYNGSSPFAAVEESDESNNAFGPVLVPVVCPVTLGESCLPLEDQGFDQSFRPAPRPLRPRP